VAAFADTLVDERRRNLGYPLGVRIALDRAIQFIPQVQPTPDVVSAHVADILPGVRDQVISDPGR
jgi:hypothetical protein